jgi:arylsulfatase
MMHATDLAREKAIQFLRERLKDQPFALTVAFFPPMHLLVIALGIPKMSPCTFIPEPKDAWDKVLYFVHAYENIGRMRWKERFQGKERYQTQTKNYYRLITEIDSTCQ